LKTRIGIDVEGVKGSRKFYEIVEDVDDLVIIVNPYVHEYPLALIVEG